ncbi:MAG: nuclear transport factor 2 family protein [bacterium]|nr:nuclear transport factor 2 family protein [bacterium]
MEDIERLLIERECERLVTAYCHYVDHGEAARIAELFTEDGVWASPQVTMKGRAELEQGFQARQDNAARMSRHICHNFLCDVQDANRAEGVVYLTLYRHDGDPERAISPLEGPEMVGEYRDRFERTPEGWRIAERRTVVSFFRGAK